MQRNKNSGNRIIDSFQLGIWAFSNGSRQSNDNKLRSIIQICEKLLITNCSN